MGVPISADPIILIRHPAPDIDRRLCYGRLDVGLSAEGHGAIPGIVAELAAHVPARIWTSPARRCRLLAAAIADAHDLAPPEPDARLWEIDFGAWEGRAWDDLPRHEFDAWAADPVGTGPPGGEPGHELIARVRHFIGELAPGQAHIVVAHGGPLRLMPALLRGEAPDIFKRAPGFGVVQVITRTA